ncbi:YihY/virulence factor BrkB family protein [uncultured Dietzia sp.]|uniref:YihY/virulence factor BrkB family protein n=1 Tax=uncultured Dietzia sp. TaxID=395519 RepID=UPI0025F4387A|nr:YihY/virulence factor BrkB family protein [uncultured Dietzia sp.]
MTDARAAELIAGDETLHRRGIGYLREREGASEVPGTLARRGAVYALRRALPKFNSDNCMDMASGLTYHAVLSLLPTMIVLVSLLGVFGRGDETVQAVMQLLNDSVPQATVEFLRGPVESLVRTRAAGLALVVGLLGALWTASSYVGAFGRALNRIYGVGEGRPFWWRRPAFVLLTAFLVALLACAALILTLTGGLAESVFRFVGLGDLALTVWSFLKWPALVAIVVLVIGILYQLTPNVRRPRFRYLSPGTIVALVVTIAGGWGFTFYASHFSNYNATYGSLAGAIIFLFLIWISNNALLLGAEIDSELIRARLLLAGVEAEEVIPLPLRDGTSVIKAHRKTAALVADGAELRHEAELGDGAELRHEVAGAGA